MPETIEFITNGITCAASRHGDHYTLNMYTCAMNFGERPSVVLEHMPDGTTRVIFNDGQLWFDTDEHSADRLKALFS